MMVNSIHGIEASFPSDGNTSDESPQNDDGITEETFYPEDPQFDGDVETGNVQHINDKRSRRNRPALTRVKGSRHVTRSRVHRVNWREFMPKTRNPLQWVKWLTHGYTDEKKSSAEMSDKFNSLAWMLCLLRDYEGRFGMPESGGPQDQQVVVRGLTERLYGSGAPIWVLESVMTRTTEGLTGTRNVNFFLLPRKAFIFYPPAATTVMFPIDRANNMYKLDLVEKVMVRLASFASNTSSVSSVAASFPPKHTFDDLAQSVRLKEMDRDDLAQEILNLASDGAGLFFFTHHKDMATKKGTDCFEDQDTEDFWNVEDSTKELFSRLAALEAKSSIAKIDEKLATPLYPTWAMMLFRAMSSACATAVSFKGHWADILVAGLLAVIVAYVGVVTSSTRQERLLTEVIASLIAGLVAGLIAITWPGETCFGAMAVGGVVNILQGSRVVYSVILLMSKHTVTGTADLIEAVIFSGLICYSLKFGQDIAESILGRQGSDEWTCGSGIDTWWYFLFVPLNAIAWAGLMTPYYTDLPVMALHGVLAWVVFWAMREETKNTYATYFVSALTVATSAGLVSRFTGRQALGNTACGMYVLLPGSYLVKSLFGVANTGFLETITINAIVIGLGAWTGTLICSPTLLGTNAGLLQRSSKRNHQHHNAMLYF